MPFELKNGKQSQHDSKLTEMTMNLEVGPWGQAKINSCSVFLCDVFESAGIFVTVWQAKEHQQTCL